MMQRDVVTLELVESVSNLVEARVMSSHIRVPLAGALFPLFLSV